MDFSPLLNWLQGMGTWGHAAALVLGLALPALFAWLKSRVTPTPPASPAAATPARPDAGRPFLAPLGVSFAPADAGELVKQRAAIEQAIETKRAALAAELDKLSPPKLPA